VKNKIIRILRIVHRDLGFFVVGMTLVYGISGIILNHMDGKDPAFRTEKKIIQMPTNLTEEELTLEWQDNKKLPNLKRVIRKDESNLRLFLDSGIGMYNISNGLLEYETHKMKPLVFWINRLHYSKVKGWSLVADFFAGALILLAITGIFIVKGKHSIAGTGKWYLIIGILIPIIFGIYMLIQK